MKKSELLNVLAENQVKSTNLRSFINKNKKNKELVKNFELTKKWLVEVEEIGTEEERKIKIKKQADKFNLSVKKYKELQDILYNFMGSINSGYSMGDLKKVYVNNELFFVLDDTQEYARSCKYSPTHGLIRLDLNKKQLMSLEKSGYNGATCTGRQYKSKGNKGTFKIWF